MQIQMQIWMQIEIFFVPLHSDDVSHPVESPIQHMCGDADGSSFYVGCSSVHTYKRLAMLSGSWMAVHVLEKNNNPKK